MNSWKHEPVNIVSRRLAIALFTTEYPRSASPVRCNCRLLAHRTADYVGNPALRAIERPVAPGPTPRFAARSVGNCGFHLQSEIENTVLSTASRLARGATRQSLFLHTLRRAVILFLLGIVVNSFPFFHLHTMRFYGVLPRIAICYLIVATLYIFRPEWRSKAGLAVAALVGYWLLMRFVPVPGYGTPTHEIPLKTVQTSRVRKTRSIPNGLSPNQQICGRIFPPHAQSGTSW